MRVILLAVLLAAPALGRDLPVPAAKGWQHAATGLTIRPTVAGLPRTALTDATAGEWDVAAQFNDPDVHESTTLYLFHAATPDAAIWFDRATYALEHRPTYGGVRATGPATAFALPGRLVATGLRRSYAPNKGPYRSSAVAVVPIGPWLVALRLSSSTLDPSALDARLTAAIAEIGWPKELGEAIRQVAPVPPCADHLRFKNARLRKPDMTQALFGSLLASAAAIGKGKPGPDDAKPWCRDGDGSDNYGVYRREGTSDGYLLALGDAGRTASVFPAFAIPPAPPAGLAVNLTDVDGSAATYPTFDALPQPAQVFQLVARGRPISQSSGTGKDITISAGALPKD